MTDYLGYTPSEYAVDAPATSLHYRRWFENWMAGFEGAPGAPRLNVLALNGGIILPSFALNSSGTAIIDLARVGHLGFFADCSGISGATFIRFSFSVNNGASWGAWNSITGMYAVAQAKTLFGSVNLITGAWVGGTGSGVFTMPAGIVNAVLVSIDPGSGRACTFTPMIMGGKI